MSEATLKRIESFPSTQSKAMLEVREVRAKLHEELDGLLPEERRRFFEDEHQKYRKWIEQIKETNNTAASYIQSRK